ncbi:MAG: hypothetical protein ACYTGF_01330 [Planctomycetota bacterium]|jgi:hypothetical protein
MRYEKALGPAAVCTVVLAVIIGGATSPGPGPPVSSGDLTAVQVTHGHSGTVLRVTDARDVWSIGMWIDETLQHPRSRIDLRKMPPATNELVVEFSSGDHRTFHFSGGPMPVDEEALGEADSDDSRKGARQPCAEVFVLEYEGKQYLTDVLHPLFGFPMHPGHQQDASGFGYRWELTDGAVGGPGGQ